MDPLMISWAFLIGILVGVIGGITLLYRTAVSPLHRKIAQLSQPPDDIRSLMKYYPYPPHNFRFLGTPINGIQFEDDTIFFISFLKNSSTRTPEQLRIKKLIDAKQVSWIEFKTP